MSVDVSSSSSSPESSWRESLGVGREEGEEDLVRLAPTTTAAAGYSDFMVERIRFRVQLVLRIEIRVHRVSW